MFGVWEKHGRVSIKLLRLTFEYYIGLKAVQVGSIYDPSFWEVQDSSFQVWDMRHDFKLLDLNPKQYT